MTCPISEKFFKVGNYQTNQLAYQLTFVCLGGQVTSLLASDRDVLGSRHTRSGARRARARARVCVFVCVCVCVCVLVTATFYSELQF